MLATTRKHFDANRETVWRPTQLRVSKICTLIVFAC